MIDICKPLSIFDFQFRSTSSSPRRHLSPECGKLKMVSAGSSFCLVKDQPSDDIRNGRKSPFISNRAWPKALRTRSASKERISSKHKFLQAPIEQIKAFQDKKAPVEQQFSRNLSDIEDNMAGQVKNDNFIRSQSTLNIASHASTTRTRPKGILKQPNQNVAKVQDRIFSYKQNIEDTKSKHQKTLPWNSKICSVDKTPSSLRKTCSSPCLFVDKNSVKIKQGKTPVKLFGTMTTVANLIEETLAAKVSKESNHGQTDESSAENFVKSASEQGISPENLLEYDVRMHQSTNERSREASEVKNKNIPTELKTKHLDSNYSNNSHRMQNYSVKYVQTNKNNINFNGDGLSVSSIRTSGSMSPTMTSSPVTSVLSSAESSLKNIKSASANSSLLPSQSVMSTENISNNSKIFSHSNDVCLSSSNKTVACGMFCADKDTISMTLGDDISEIGREGVKAGGEPVTDLSQEMSVKQRSSNNPEHFNSSSDEEIQKELSSILTNGHPRTDTTSLLRPRFLTNPMKFNPSGKMIQNYAKSVYSDDVSRDKLKAAEKNVNDTSQVFNFKSNQESQLIEGREATILAGDDNTECLESGGNIRGYKEEGGGGKEADRRKQESEAETDISTIYTSQVQTHSRQINSSERGKIRW